MDLLFTCGVVAVLAAMAIPSLHASRERDVVRMAARHLAQELQLLRIEALRRNRAAAMRFDPDDLGGYAMFVDGDGDGVLQQDVDRGVDPAIGERRHLAHLFPAIALQIAATVPVPDGTGTVAAGSDPIRIGNSNFVSFSPVGSSTSGTIYLASRGGTQLCVRLLGATGRIRVLWFDRGAGAWRAD